MLASRIIKNSFIRQTYCDSLGRSSRTTSRNLSHQSAASSVEELHQSCTVTVPGQCLHMSSCAVANATQLAAAAVVNFMMRWIAGERRLLVRFENFAVQSTRAQTNDR